jgi:hypothetical protein
MMGIHSIHRKFERLLHSINKSKVSTKDDLELIATITFNSETNKTTIKRINNGNKNL